MATEKKPSIYDDRGTIGSSDELDEYGVWVKSEPQDLSSMQPNNQEFIEPSIPDIEELPDFDTGFETGTNDSAAGDSRNDSFEFIDEELSIPDMAVSDDSPDTTEDTVFDEVSLDDIMASDNTEQAGLSLDSQDEQDGTRDLDGEADFTEVSIDDISQPEGSPGPEAPAEEFSDISMEDFTAVSVDDFIDSDPGASPELDMEPEPEREAPEQEAPPASGGYGEIHSMITSASDDEIFMSDFDDVEALSQDIRSSQRTPKSENPDLSTQLLMKIAEELSSIKGELSSLKSELSVIRGEESAEAAPAEQGGGRGFFDEEDDEKIALTGDELDNILNTADFTEEAGADAGESLTDDFSSLGGDEDFSSEPFPELEDSSPDLSGGLPEEPPAILSDQPDIIGGEAPEEEEKIEPDIPLETDQEESFQPEDIAAGESQEPAAFEDSIVLDEPELDELKGEHSIIGDSFDSQEFDVSFEPSLEEETDELASSDAVAEEDTGPQESDFEEISMDELTLDKDVISLDFAEDDLSEVSEEIGPDEELKEKDAEELQVLRTEGAKPMTEAPEDTSYLEEDPLAADHIDLSGAVIDEPDLSGDITENPVQEPSLENISIDLDLEESEDLEIPEDIEVSEDLEIPEDIEVSEDLGVSEDIEISEDLEISEDIEISEDLGVSEESEDPDVSEGIAGGEISEEIGFEIELDDEEESPLPGGGEAPETGDDEEPPVSISFGDVSESEELKPEEESFAQVIPEGFVVEPDDSQSAFDTVDTGEALQEEDLDILEGDTADELSPEAAAEEKGTKEADTGAGDSGEMSYIPSNIKHELKTVLSYMDQLLESLPEEKIEEFAKSEYFETYKKLFEELGLV